MSFIVAVLLVFIAIGGTFGAVAFFVYRKKLRRAKSIERGLKMVPIKIHLPPPSSDTQGGSRDVKEVMREKTSQAEVLYNLIAGTATSGFKSNFYGQRHIALELIAADGIVHFYAAVPVALVSSIEKAIQTAYPGSRLERVEDHNIFNQEGRLAATLGGEMVLREISAYPIATYAKLDRDPMEALLTTISALDKHDGVGVQLMVRPANPKWVDQSIRVANLKRKGHSASGISPLDVMKAVIKSPHQSADEQASKPGGGISNLEQAEVESIEDKTRHPGFEVLVRVLVSTGSVARSQQLLRDIATTFALYESPGLNGFKFLPAIDVQGLVTAFIFRFFPPELNSNVLNSVELATLFHLPDAQFTPTSSIERQKSKQVDGPTSLPSVGLLFGFNEFRGANKEIRLSVEDRRRHTYILGQTGTGKSTMLENLAVQDMLSGNGFAFIDPHGDSAEKLLALVPKERAEDVIYFNPADTEYPLGLNLFEFSDPAQKDFLVQETINMLYKLYDPGKTGIIGPRFEQWYRNAALTLMSDPNGSTFVEIPKVFTDTDYLKNKFKYLKDPTVIEFWTKEMGQTSDYHKSEMLGWFASKFGAFLNNEMMRNIIGQTHSAFNIRDVMDQKKILIVNLSKGKVGELNSALLGMIFVIKFQAAAMSRANIPENERTDFSLYVDEFQNFSTDSFASILSEARKYRLNLIVANQFVGQLKPEIRDAVFGNIGTIVAHRMGPEDAEFMVKQFAPIFDASDLMNIPNYQAAMRLMIGGLPSQPFTIADNPPLGTPNLELGLAVKQLSAAKFGTQKQLVEADIVSRLSPKATKPAPPNEPAAASAPAAPGQPSSSAVPAAAVAAIIAPVTQSAAQPEPAPAAITQSAPAVPTVTAANAMATQSGNAPATGSMVPEVTAPNPPVNNLSNTPAIAPIMDMGATQLSDTPRAASLVAGVANALVTARIAPVQMSVAAASQPAAAPLPPSQLLSRSTNEESSMRDSGNNGPGFVASSAASAPSDVPAMRGAPLPGLALSMAQDPSMLRSSSQDPLNDLADLAQVPRQPELAVVLAGSDPGDTAIEDAVESNAVVMSAPPIGAPPIDIPQISGPAPLNQSNNANTLSFSDITGAAAPISEVALEPAEYVSPLENVPLFEPGAEPPLPEMPQLRATRGAGPQYSALGTGVALDDDPYANIELLGDLTPPVTSEFDSDQTSAAVAAEPIFEPAIDAGEPLPNDPNADISLMGGDDETIMPRIAQPLPQPSQIQNLPPTPSTFSDDLAPYVEPQARAVPAYEPRSNRQQRSSANVPILSDNALPAAAPQPTFEPASASLRAEPAEQPAIVPVSATPEIASAPSQGSADSSGTFIHFVDPSAQKIMNQSDLPSTFEPNSMDESHELPSNIQTLPDGLPAGVQLVNQANITPSPQPVQNIIPTPVVVLAPPSPALRATIPPLIAPIPITAATPALPLAPKIDVPPASGLVFAPPSPSIEGARPNLQPGLRGVQNNGGVNVSVPMSAISEQTAGNTNIRTIEIPAALETQVPASAPVTLPLGEDPKQTMNPVRAAPEVIQQRTEQQAVNVIPSAVEARLAEGIAVAAHPVTTSPVSAIDSRVEIDSKTMVQPVKQPASVLAAPEVQKPVNYVAPANVEVAKLAVNEITLPPVTPAQQPAVVPTPDPAPPVALPTAPIKVSPPQDEVQMMQPSSIVVPQSVPEQPSSNPSVPDPMATVTLIQPITPQKQIEQAENNINNLVAQSFIRTSSHQRLPDPVEPINPDEEDDKLARDAAEHSQHSLNQEVISHHGLKVINPIAPIVSAKEKFAKEIAELNQAGALFSQDTVATTVTPTTESAAPTRPSPVVAPTPQVSLQPAAAIAPVPQAPTPLPAVSTPQPLAPTLVRPIEKPHDVPVAKHAEAVAPPPAASFDDDTDLPPPVSLAMADVAKARAEREADNKPQKGYSTPLGAHFTAQSLQPHAAASTHHNPVPHVKPSKPDDRTATHSPTPVRPVVPVPEEIQSTEEAIHNTPTAAQSQAAPLMGKLIMPTGEKPQSVVARAAHTKPKKLTVGEVYVDEHGNVSIGE